MADTKPRLRLVDGRWQEIGSPASVSAPTATSLPFKEQAAFWRRKVNVPTDTWRDVQREDHAQAFMVAGAARVDLLDDLRKAVDKAVLGGGSIESFRKDFDAVVARTGWEYNGGRNWRTRIIYTTNVRSSYMAGRWQQIQAIKHRRPYMEYVHNDSVRHPRPQHLAWNGTILLVDDPWWNTHYCPNGYGCQCTTRTLAQRDMDALGKTGPDEAPTSVDDTTGIDPGFDYNVGQAAASMPAADRMGQKIMTMPKPFRDAALSDAQRRQADMFADWPAAVRRAQSADADMPSVQQPVGFVRPRVAQRLDQGTLPGRADKPLTSALLTADDDALATALASTEGNALSALQRLAQDLPQVLADGTVPVLWDAHAQQLLYAHAIADGRFAVASFALDATGPRGRGQGGAVSGRLQTLALLDAAHLATERYQLLDGAL
ncbi:phage minor head protein [Luteibacter sp.]|uniref:phage head morphogenesis protein n=1 Tax=Luteibacter sp. TaxID=1886636 RepID=UPI002F3F937C